MSKGQDSILIGMLLLLVAAPATAQVAGGVSGSVGGGVGGGLGAPAKEQAQADRAYQRGTKALDERQWEKAISAFDEVAKTSPRADGALYWKAYAQNKLGRRTEALAAIAELEKSFPNSRWINDAKALEVEVRQATSQPVSPESETDEDLKLMAINSLMHSEPERALPLLQKVLAGSNPPKVKERALFVLSQSGSPRAREIVAEVARGKSNPDLQRKALQYLGLFGGTASRQVLAEIYDSSTDPGVKRSILQSFMVAGERDRLLAAARQEKAPELRKVAIQQLGVMGAQAQLWELYQAESSTEVKKAILKGMFVGGNGEKLAELARSEKDPSLRRAAIQSLGLVDKKYGDALVAIYSSDSDKAIRKAVQKALFVQGNDKALIEIARKETDPELKKHAVQVLSIMGSKEAKDYMLEILNK
jgi:HEAT repeat protein